MLGATDANRRRDERIPEASRDLLCQARSVLRVHEEREVRTVLLDGTRRENGRRVTRVESGADLGRRHVFQRDVLEHWLSGEGVRGENPAARHDRL
jgi:hypothetical protein